MQNSRFARRFLVKHTRCCYLERVSIPLNFMWEIMDITGPSALHHVAVHKSGNFLRRGNILPPADFSKQRSYTKMPAKKKPDCPYCGKRLPSNAELARHILVHTGEKPFKCELCSRSFKSKQAMKYHMVQTHSI